MGYVPGEKWRLVRAMGAALMFVASEPEGRKLFIQSVEPSRDCCVNA